MAISKVTETDICLAGPICCLCNVSNVRYGTVHTTVHTLPRPGLFLSFWNSTFKLNEELTAVCTTLVLR